MKLPLHVERAIRRLAEEGVVNAYIYDLVPLREKVRRLKALAPEGVEVFYAMKANPHPAFLAAARKAGVAGIEIASLGEGEKALAAGFAPAELIFTGPGKRPEELAWSVKNRIRAVHIESLTEAHRLAAICRVEGVRQDVLVRVNANFSIHEAQTTFSGGSRKFGIDEEKLEDALIALRALPELSVRGLHVFAASGVLDAELLLKNCELVFQLARRLEDAGLLQAEVVDFGGGFGVDYEDKGRNFDLAAWAEGLRGLIAEYGFAGRRFVLELGRWLAAECGWFCTEILDIKDSRGKKQVICAGGINHFRRPAALGVNHPLMIVRMQRPPVFAGQARVRRERAYFGGPLCTGADKLGDEIFVEAADIGDVAVFGLAGAYGLTMSNIEFLSHPRPPEIVLEAEED